MILVLLIVLTPLVGIIAGLIYAIGKTIKDTRQAKRERSEAAKRIQREALEKYKQEEAKREKRRFEIEEEIAHLENMLDQLQRLYNESTPRQRLAIDNKCYMLRKKLNKLYYELD